MTTLERRWADLRLWRLCLGIVVAPLPAAIIALTLATLTMRLAPHGVLLWARALVGTAIVWSVLVGGLCCFAASLWRPAIARRACLIAGGILGVLFPCAVIVVRNYGPAAPLDFFAFSPDADALPAGLFEWTDPSTYFILAASGVFGVLGGWIFWSIGIEPAAVPNQEAPHEARRRIFAAYGADYPADAAAAVRKPARRLAFGDISIGRLLAGLFAGGLISSLTMVDLVFVDAHRLPYWQVAAVLAGSEFLWIVPGALTLLVLWRMRGFLRRRDCLVLGVALAWIVPYAAVQTAQLMGPLAAMFREIHGHVHSAGPIDISFISYAGAGAFAAPTGALGGWILWRLVSPHGDESDVFSPTGRHGKPISARVILGVAITALLPAIATMVVVIAVFSNGEPNPLAFAWAFGAAELAGLLAGPSLLFLVTAKQPICRAHCLWIGMGVSLVLPLVTYHACVVLSRLGADIHLQFALGWGEVGAIAATMFMGYVLMPVGLPGGWMLWRLGFRDRRLAPIRLSSVFE